MDDLVKRLRDNIEKARWTTHPIQLEPDEAEEIADRIEQLERSEDDWNTICNRYADRNDALEAALRECEAIVERYQKQNEQNTEWQGSGRSQMKARAVAARCGMLLGDIRKHVRAVLENKECP